VENLLRASKSASVTTASEATAGSTTRSPEWPWPLPHLSVLDTTEAVTSAPDLGGMNLVHDYLADQLHAGRCSWPACLILFG
jgi:hypothetical protein